MRESEVNEKYNGVIWYLLGAWFSLKFFPKDVSTMSILLLSWCDTAASTIGRLWGRYTPRIRKGKSLAGSAAAALVGVATSVIFYGVMVPRNFGYEEDFMYSGNLGLPEVTKRSLGLVAKGQGAIGGWLALGAMSLWSGLVASASEVVDIFGLDDNLTIPILSGLGLCGFLTVFG
jgi:diacylglycerol kinase (CTP)